jgi:hypothetical protein
MDNSDDEYFSLDEQVILMNDTFQYLWLMFQSDGQIDEDVIHRIRAR